MSEKTTLLDRIRELLEEEGPGRKELAARVAELEEAERQREDTQMSAWMRHYALPDSYHPELPVPRLQIKVEDHEYGERYYYDLIYRHHLDHLVAVPLGFTRSSGSAFSRASSKMGKIRTPHRDCYHMASDSRHLGLPAFLVDGDRTEVFDVEEWTPGGVADYFRPDANKTKQPPPVLDALPAAEASHEVRDLPLVEVARAATALIEEIRGCVRHAKISGQPYQIAANGLVAQLLAAYDAATGEAVDLPIPLTY